MREGLIKIGAQPTVLSDILTNENADMCCVIKDLMPMSLIEIQSWFQRATENKIKVFDIQKVIKNFTEQLITQGRRQSDNVDYNMVDVEELQEAVYLAALKKK